MGNYSSRTISSLKRIFLVAATLGAAPAAFCAGSSGNVSLKQAVAEYDAKNYKSAQKSLSSYLQTNSNDYKAHFYLGNSLVKLGRLDDASNEYKKVLTLTPDSKTGTSSMEAFNKIADMHSATQSKPITNSHANASLPPPPVAQIAAQPLSQFPQTQLRKIAPSAQSFPQAPFVVTNSFGYAQNFANNARNNSDLIPASVAGSGAKVSPTVNSRDSISFPNGIQFGQRNFGNHRNRGFNPYGNSGSQNQFSNSGFGNSGFGGSGFGGSGFGNSGNGNFGNGGFGQMRHRGHRYGNAMMGNQNSRFQGGRNSSYQRDALRNHMGGYIQNYEITDTPSGNAVPLVAEQKKFEDLATETTGTQSGIAASKVAKSKRQ